MKKLPNTLHQLLHTALNDIGRANGAKNLKIDMGHWLIKNVNKEKNEPCSVCLAGAVMYYQLKMKPKRLVCKKTKIESLPNDVKDLNTERKLKAIDNLRFFNFQHAYRLIFVREMSDDDANKLYMWLANILLNNPKLSISDIENFKLFDVSWSIYSKLQDKLRQLSL